MRFDNVWFLSDYGLEDEFVGVVKAVIRAIAPHVTVGDVTHQIPPHDIRAGALALARSMQYLTLVPSVILAVVDPGVGSDRRALAVEAGGADGEPATALLVGPDNGLLMPAAKALGFVRARGLANRALWRDEVSATFHARDVFGPVAAHLDRGTPARDVGPEVSDAQPLDFGLAREEAGELVAEVAFLDSFGNCVTNISAALARAALREGALARVSWAGGAVDARFVRTYADGSAGEPLLLVGSAGFLEIAIARGNFAEQSGLEVGMEVRLRA